MLLTQAEANSGEKLGGCRKMQGWLWAKVGLDMSNHQNVAWGGSLICIY